MYYSPATDLFYLVEGIYHAKNGHTTFTFRSITPRRLREVINIFYC